MEAEGILVVVSKVLIYKQWEKGFHVDNFFMSHVSTETSMLFSVVNVVMNPRYYKYKRILQNKTPLLKHKSTPTNDLKYPLH